MPSDNIFRIFKPPGHAEDPVEKRRAQLRRAQQTYRERKDRYAKSLETEITRTRAKEATLVREVERLQGIVHRLLAFLSQAGWDTIQINELRDEFEDIQSTNASTANPALTEPSGSVVGRAKHGPRTSPTQTHLEPVGALNAGLSPLKPGIRMCDLDPVETGIDFVLTLERPCLAHLHGNPDKPLEPAGHALTASAQVFSVAPQSPARAHLPSGSTLRQNVPGAILESLINLSSELIDSDQEVTPVQAWHHIRHQPQFGGLEVRSLCGLAETLRDSVKCHGFGAVIERDKFETQMLDMLLLGRPF